MLRILDNRDTCLDCKYAKKRMYETGTIDDIEYRCVLQNNKLIYDDLHPLAEDFDYADAPDCPISMFEQGDSSY